MSEITSQLDANGRRRRTALETSMWKALHRAGICDDEVQLVYVVQAGEDGPLKIGRGAGLDPLLPRLRKLQTACAYPVLVRRVLLGDADAERKLHRRFTRARMQGEWFKPTPTLERFAAG